MFEDFCLRRRREGKSHEVIVFEKLRFQNVFRPHENENSAFLNSSVWRAFSWRINVDSRPNRRNKAAFSFLHFFGVLWHCLGPILQHYYLCSSFQKKTRGSGSAPRRLQCSNLNESLHLIKSKGRNKQRGMPAEAVILHPSLVCREHEYESENILCAIFQFVEKLHFVIILPL